MKKYTLLHICVVALALCSCSKDNETDRLYQVDAPLTSRCVLIEDFTGQDCLNCPKGTEEINKLIETYGEEHVIPVAIHSGSFGVSENSSNFKRYAPVALKTDFTQQYWDKWFDNTQGQPVAKINRGEKTDDYGDWFALARVEMAKAPEVDVDVNCGYNEATRTVDITAYVKSEGKTGKLQLWVLEDSIVATQKLPDGSRDKTYKHNHVLRAAVNGDWGEDVKLNSGVFEKVYKYTLPQTYNADNCSIAGFVYNDEDGILQATKCAIRVKN